MKDEEIFEYGDIGDTYYIILSGVVSVMVPVISTGDDNSTEGKNFTETCTLSAGKAFGELALLCEQPRAATVVAKTECEMLTLDKKSYNKILGGFD